MSDSAKKAKRSPLSANGADSFDQPTVNEHLPLNPVFSGIARRGAAYRKTCLTRARAGGREREPADLHGPELFNRGGVRRPRFRVRKP
jgi:hypothetical protein